MTLFKYGDTTTDMLHPEQGFSFALHNLRSLRVLDVTCTSRHPSQLTQPIAKTIYEVLTTVTSPNIQEVYVDVDITRAIAASGHDVMDMIRPGRYPEYSAFREYNILQLTMRPVFANIVRVKVVLYFCYDRQIWDAGDAQRASVDIIKRMQLYFTFWVSRAVLDMSCSTPYGHYTLPKTPNTSS